MKTLKNPFEITDLYNPIDGQNISQLFKVFDLDIDSSINII